MHAAGPWLPEDPDFPGVPIVMDGYHRTIATLVDTGWDEPTDKANAHLLAAAPDLLAACEKASALLTGSAYNYLRDAIAKARGQ